MTEERRDNRWQWVRRVPHWVWALICLALAIIYAIIWPSANAPADTTSFRYVALRWFHALAWVLLAVSFLVRLTGQTRLANGIAFLALPTYALFFMVNLGML